MNEQQSIFLEAHRCCRGGEDREVRYEDLVYAMGVIKEVRAYKRTCRTSRHDQQVLRKRIG